MAIQNRLEYIKKTELNTNIKIEIMRDILNLISKGDFTSSSLTIDQGSIRLEGLAYSIFTVNSFINHLKENKNVVSIILDDFSSGNEGIHFSITVELKTEKQETKTNT